MRSIRPEAGGGLKRGEGKRGRRSDTGNPTKTSSQQRNSRRHLKPSTLSAEHANACTQKSKARHQIEPRPSGNLARQHVLLQHVLNFRRGAHRHQVVRDRNSRKQQDHQQQQRHTRCPSRSPTSFDAVAKRRQHHSQRHGNPREIENELHWNRGYQSLANHVCCTWPLRPRPG